MAIATLIIPVSENYPSEVNEIIASDKRQTISLDVILSVCPNPFNLSRARNLGAKKAATEWLIFADADLTFDDDLFQRMINVGADCVTGKTRNDVFGDKYTYYYHCSCSPILIRRELFERMGGYCEEYQNYGYEDSDWEHKIPVMPVEFDSKAHHVVNIHKKIAQNGWNIDPNLNRALFEKRMAIPKEDRIRADLIKYNVS